MEDKGKRQRAVITGGTALIANFPLKKFVYLLSARYSSCIISLSAHFMRQGFSDFGFTSLIRHRNQHNREQRLLGIFFSHSVFIYYFGGVMEN